MGSPKRTTEIIQGASAHSASLRDESQKQLVSRYWELGRAVVRSRLNDSILRRVGASEIANDVMLKLFSDLEHHRVQFQSSDEFEQALRHRLKLKAIDKAREQTAACRSVESQVPLENAASVAAAPDEHILAQEVIDLVTQYIASIQDPEIRAIIEQNLLAGWSNPEIHAWMVDENPSKKPRSVSAIRLLVVQHRRDCAALLTQEGFGPDVNA